MMRNGTVLSLFVVGLVACGSDNAKSSGNGGAMATGGTASSGGVTGTGGKSSSGGAAGTPLTGKGGAGSGEATGGAVGSGGLLGSGGNLGGAGASGRDAAVATGGTGSGGATGPTSLSDAGSPGDARSNPSGDGATAKDVPLAQGDAPDAAAATCTGTSTLKAGDNKLTLQFGGRTRSYIAYVPSALKSGTAVPLVFDFHGHGSNAADEESTSGWKKKADQVGIIMVYPDGVDSSWNVGSCCGLAMSENVDDVGFTKAIIQAMSKVACIDAKRIYATGMSNGGGFVHRLGCEAADVLAAIAPASADLVTDPCTPARPISVLAVRGLADTMVKYEGGKTGSTGWNDPGAKASLELWKKIDQCSGSTTTSHQYCESYTQCSAGTEDTLCSLPDTGHDTYNNAVKLSVPDVAWEMFQRQPMP
jgi:polyhydroxybutyrate depolymerase